MITLLSLQKIWDKAEHNALTDLIHYNGMWFCTFREADLHQKGKDGTIRLLYSEDATVWTSAHLFEEQGIDLRDPKLSITPDGKLMLLMEGVTYLNQKYITRQPRVSFSNDGFTWTKPTIGFSPHEWPWGLTWFQNKAYSVSYRYSDPSDTRKPWIISLCVTEDGIHYDKLCEWDISYYPSEATIRFQKSGEMVILLRQSGKERREWEDPNWIGTSKPPFTDWEWKQTSHHLGGPNFLILDQGDRLAAGRIIWPTPYGIMEKTVIAEMTKEDIQPIFTLPSGGDSSYPGMVFHNETLYVSYYSSHENKTAIYLATMRLT